MGTGASSVTSTTAVVIGAGFGGIAAALRLRAKGYNVTVVDRCSKVGGRAQVFERDGYRHDAGPTVITAPFLFEELFELFGKRIQDYVTIKPLDTWYRFYFPDGIQFDYGGSIEDTLAQIEQIEPADKQGYLDLLDASRAIYQLGFEQLAHQPFHRLSELCVQAPAMLKLGSYRSVWDLVSRHLKSERLRQAFSIQPLLVGGNPFQTTSIYNLIHFLERAHGIHFAMGGTGALTDALGRLMAEEDITIRLGETVESVCVENGRAKGVHTEHGFTAADVVISNVDPAHLYDNMLERKDSCLSARIKTRYARKSMGLFVLYFGTNRLYPDVAHHTIWLGSRYKELLTDIFTHKILADDFSIYLHRPTATDPSFAPEGHESFYALVPVPNLEGSVAWDIEGPRLRDRIVEALGSTLLPGLKESIRSDFFMTPENFQQDYLSPDGAGFSIAPTFYQSAWFRYHNKAEGPNGLYLVGAGTHPGAGLPGVLCSAKVLEVLVPRAAGVDARSKSNLALA
ncbi:phytoene dehydrogenase [Halioglobus sp. HI00S01]|nr:phytoene dehydrogenase [Halioglobus sp. HI00S01]